MYLALTLKKEHVCFPRGETVFNSTDVSVFQDKSKSPQGTCAAGSLLAGRPAFVPGSPAEA